MAHASFDGLRVLSLESRRAKEVEKLIRTYGGEPFVVPAMREVNELVLHYKGSLSGEHNDGLVRGPWLEEMYGKHMVELFRATKDIFDPQHIFNPHKKANSDWDYSFSHIREHF